MDVAVITGGGGGAILNLGGAYLQPCGFPRPEAMFAQCSTDGKFKVQRSWDLLTGAE